MNKRTARAVLASQRTIHRAIDILSREIDKLEKMGASNLRDDLGWTYSQLSRVVEEGLGHHVDDAEEALPGWRP